MLLMFSEALSAMREWLPRAARRRRASRRHALIAVRHAGYLRLPRRRRRRSRRRRYGHAERRQQTAATSPRHVCVTRRRHLAADAAAATPLPSIATPPLLTLIAEFCRRRC